MLHDRNYSEDCAGTAGIVIDQQQAKLNAVQGEIKITTKNS